MRTRKPWRLGIILLAAPLLLAITSEGGYPQVPAPPIPNLSSPLESHRLAMPAPLSVPHVIPATALAPTPSPTVEQLLDQIAMIRAQKAELDQREQALVKTLRERLAAQKERLSKLGIAESAAAPRTQVDDVPPPPMIQPK